MSVPTGKWLAVDPGEDTGFSVWEGENLIEADTAKLWEFGKAFYAALHDDPETLDFVGDDLAKLLSGVDTVVCEDFRIYPWEAKAGTLNWDQVRTARLIGALTLLCMVQGITFVLQPAKIKERAMAAGAKAFFLSPLYENRHANDSIMHAVYYLAIQRGTNAVEERDA